ncbi:DUF4350 domain-containing protein, partial [Angustibacter peucedani]
MTVTAGAPAPADERVDDGAAVRPGDRPGGPTRPGRLQRWRWPLGIGALVLAATLVGLLLARPQATGALDPENPAPEGARALAQVLRDHGVEVRVRTRFSDVQADLGQRSGDVAVVVARPERMGGTRPHDLGELVAADRADLVLVGAGNGVLTDLDLPFGATAAGDVSTVEPGCDAPVPTRAGSVVMGDVGYAPLSTGGVPDVDAVSSCYPVDAGGARPAAAFVELAYRDGRRTTLLGPGAPLTNDRLSDAGDAALAVGVLGRQPLLVWWTPDPLDGGQAEPPTLTDLLPDGVRFAGVQLLVVLGVVVLWRGRRLGRLVPERLAVVVRALETTQGRAQLYRKARARGRAAQVLRAAAVRRLAVRLGLARTAP